MNNRDAEDQTVAGDATVVRSSSGDIWWLVRREEEAARSRPFMTGTDA